MENPIFSVIIPVYNLEDHLAQCLRSLQHQTVSNFEVLIIDDCSTDQSCAVIESCINQDPRFSLKKRSTNHGVSAARNIGLDNARGTYICFVDGDDWLEPDFLSQFLAAFHQAEPTELAISGHYGYLSVPGRNRDYNQHALLSSINFGIVGGFVWNKCFLKRIIDDHHLRFNEKFTFLEDQLFSFEYAVHIKNAHYNHHKTYHYRWQSNTEWKRMGFEFFSARKRLNQKLKSEGIKY
ncbi:glycosyltransferase family 2 protein [Levilactobacillus bambusae]|uniref:Glycosyltransferase family 2 protein n=1 Tax=Levilactobacillus bambusae TaxID=2024736 RepID=A0A2V1MYW6_9LACO|nr:glycosyltransferase family A protein [Levilactobacillus bambusae]PWG00204.1 glycosyltransferase family 2 protein [Levilactobacillus bambusae]